MVRLLLRRGNRLLRLERRLRSVSHRTQRVEQLGRHRDRIARPAGIIEQCDLKTLFLERLVFQKTSDGLLRINVTLGEGIDGDGAIHVECLVDVHDVRYLTRGECIPHALGDICGI